MSRHRLQELVLSWIEAMSDHDVEGVLRLYGQNIIYISPEYRQLYPDTDGVIRRRDTLQRWIEELFKREPTLVYNLVYCLVEETGKVAVQFKVLVGGNEKMDAAMVFTVDDAGLIQRSHMYIG